MKKNNYKNLLIIALLLFAGLFAYNVKQNTKESLATLKAYADNGDSGDEEEHTGHLEVRIIPYSDTQVRVATDGKRYRKERTCYTTECVGTGDTPCPDAPECGPWSAEELIN